MTSLTDIGGGTPLRLVTRQQTQKRPVVLIGPLDGENLSPIGTVTRAFMSGLADKFDFRPYIAQRRFGKRRLSRFNLVNLWYLVGHLFHWTAALARSRPAIAHYPITSFWSFEKSVVFFRVARLFGARCVGHLHGGGFGIFWEHLPEPRRDRVIREVKKLDGFIVLSHGWKSWVVREMQQDPAHVHIVSNPIDAEFESQALRMSLHRSENMILTVAMLSRRKGIFDILQAARDVLPGTGFVLTMAGPEAEPHIRDRCEDYIAAYGLEDCINLPGPVRGDAKISLFQQASIFLFPSFAENLPLAVLEAAASGLPIIASPVGALPELFEHRRSVIFVQPGDAADIAAALRHLMNHPQDRISLGGAAREAFLRNCVRRDIMRSLAEVYDTVLRRGSHGSTPMRTRHLAQEIFPHSGPV